MKALTKNDLPQGEHVEHPGTRDPSVTYLTFADGTRYQKQANNTFIKRKSVTPEKASELIAQYQGQDNPPSGLRRLVGNLLQRASAARKVVTGLVSATKKTVVQRVGQTYDAVVNRVYEIYYPVASVLHAWRVEREVLRTMPVGEHNETLDEMAGQAFGSDVATLLRFSTCMAWAGVAVWTLGYSPLIFWAMALLASSIPATIEAGYLMIVAAVALYRMLFVVPRSQWALLPAS